MITLNGKRLEIGRFPDGTLLIQELVKKSFDTERSAVIRRCFENNKELVALIYLVGHLKSHGVGKPQGHHFEKNF